MAKSKELSFQEFYESSKKIALGEFEVNLLIPKKLTEKELWGFKGY